VPAVCARDIHPEYVAHNGNVGSECVVTMVFSPSRNAKELGVALSKSNSGVIVADRNPLVCLVADRYPHVEIEERVVVICRNCGLDLRFGSQAAAQGCSKGNSTRVGGSVRAADVLNTAVDETELNSVGVVTSIVCPCGDTK